MCLQESLKGLDSLGDEGFSEAKHILGMMKENLHIWKAKNGLDDSHLFSASMKRDINLQNTQKE